MDRFSLTHCEIKTMHTAKTINGICLHRHFKIADNSTNEQKVMV